MATAFATAAGYTADSCGVLAVGDASLDVREALISGNGVIVVPDSDTTLIARLDDYVALKRVHVPKDADHLSDSLEGLGHRQLQDEARARGLKASGTSDELLHAIRAHDARESGDERAAEIAAEETE